MFAQEQPTIAWIRRALASNVRRPFYGRIIRAEILVDLESECPDRRLVIGVFIRKQRGFADGEKFTADYHMHFTSTEQWSTFQNRPVDFQFFYAGERPPKGESVTLFWTNDHH